MPSEYLIGFDIGGSNLRCMVMNIETGEHQTVLNSWKHPRAPGDDPWALDLDTDLLWKLMGDLTKEALRRADIGPGDVVGLASSSMRHGMVLIDKHNAVLFATPNSDARANSQMMDLASKRGDEIYQRTGHWPSPIFMSARLRWLFEHQPEVLSSAHAALSISDWIGHQLTGSLFAERSQAGESMLLDLRSRNWSEDLISSLDLPLEIFPPLAEAGFRLGPLTQDAADHLGLLVGTPVALGGADTQSGLLGLGVVQSGQLAIIAGSTAPVQLVTSEALIDEKTRLWTGLHILPDLYVLESNAGAMGSSLAWFANALYPESPNRLDRLSAEAGTAPVGANGIFSSVGASVFNGSDLSLPIDTLSFSSISDLGDGNTRATFSRAVLEGMAYSIRANLEQIQEVSLTKNDAIWVGGGMARSTTWLQILSDVLGCTIHNGSASESTALGAVICAGVGAGIYSDLVQGAQRLASLAPEIQPDTDTTNVYSGFFDDWQSLKEEHSDADHLISTILLDSMAERQPVESSTGESIFRPRIYISADIDQSSLQRLRSLGEATYASYREEQSLLVGEELIETISDYHVFVTEVDILDAEALQELPNLRVVISCRSNPVNVDINACSVAGVLVLNTPGRNAEAVADLTISYMLMLARKMPEATAFLRQPGGEAGDMGRMGMAYGRLQANELWGQTLGLIGAGAVGRKVIQRALPFGMRVLVYDPYQTAEQITLMGAEKASLDHVLAQSDFVSLHAASTEETRGLLDAESFSKMKDGAFLINTARAALVDQNALLDALKDEKLGGAALDVFSVEPPGSEDPLLAIPNVIATPHIGGNTIQVAAHQGAIVVKALERLLSGALPEHVLNPEVLPSFSWTGERVISKEELEKLAHGPGPGVSDLEVEAEIAEAAAAPGKADTPLPPTMPVESAVVADPKSVSPGTYSEMPTAALETPDVKESREKMIQILERFTRAIASDSALEKFARNRDVVFRFTIKPLDLVFYMDFKEGEVEAAMGEPLREHDVDLKMSADTLDGMFTKRIKAMSAAMSGKLSFSGNTKKAMAFQRAQKDMQRLYQEAREEVGDPGDLTLLSEPTKPAPSSTSTPAVKPGDTAPVVAAPAVLKTGDVRDQILKVNNELFEKRYITPTGGNVSARADENPEEIWITPSLIFKGDLGPEMMVRLDLDGKMLGETDFTASSERRVHCAIYSARPDVGAIVHSHAPQVTLMGLTGSPFLPLSTEAAMIGDIPVVPFIMPGSDELGDAVAKALGGGFAVLMQNHGLVVAATSLRQAADLTDIIEINAEKIMACRMMGVDPPVLPDDVLEMLREIGELKG